MVPAVVAGVISRLSGAIDDLQKTITSDLTGTGSAMHGATRAVLRADGAIGRRAAAAGLGGRDRHGSRVQFSLADIHSVALRDSDGHTIGVSFPTKAGDESFLKEWSQRKRLSDNEVEPMHVNGQGSVYESPEPAPWFDPDRPGPPVYVDAHGNPDGFDIEISRGSRRRPLTVNVDGETFGRILQSNKHFDEALGRSPNAPVVLLCCDTAAPSGTAAWDVADTLHDAGMMRDVYAPTGVLETLLSARTPESSVAVAFHTDSTGRRWPEFERFGPDD